MLHEFLLKNKREILSMTQIKTIDLAGAGPTSEQLQQGLPVFYDQLLTVLRLEPNGRPRPPVDKNGMAKAARAADEPAMAAASGRIDEVELAKSAGRHGVELHRLGYTLSHVVHAYGAMCQSITELATTKKVPISTSEFRDLNQCLDVAIAGAVTEYESQRNTKESSREVEHLGSLAHELRNALNGATVSFQMIKKGMVTAGGSTGQILEKSLKRMNELIDRSLTEVRLRADPEVKVESAYLLQLIDQIILTTEGDAKLRNQTFEVHIDPKLVVNADQQLFHSAISNLIHNAIKFTVVGGRVQVRGHLVGQDVVIEVEDECGGLSPNAEVDLFKPFEQQNQNRKGLGLGLTIAKRAVMLNNGTLDVHNLPGKGCIFEINLPREVVRPIPKRSPSLESQTPLH